MRYVIGKELDQVRENIASPQLGDDHYGSWGALSFDQRTTIARMVETIKFLSALVDQLTNEGPEETLEDIQDREEKIGL